MMREFEKIVSGALPKLKLMTDEPMRDHTTFRVGGPADVFVCPDSEELPVVLRLAKEHQIPVTVIGNGSNLLVSDRGIRGLVIEIGNRMDEKDNRRRTLEIPYIEVENHTIVWRTEYVMNKGIPVGVKKSE